MADPINPCFVDSVDPKEGTGFDPDGFEDSTEHITEDSMVPGRYNYTVHNHVTFSCSGTNLDPGCTICVKVTIDEWGPAGNGTWVYNPYRTEQAQITWMDSAVGLCGKTDNEVGILIEIPFFSSGRYRVTLEYGYSTDGTHCDQIKKTLRRIFDVP